MYKCNFGYNINRIILWLFITYVLHLKSHCAYTHAIDNEKCHAHKEYVIDDNAKCIDGSKPVFYIKSGIF